MNEFKMTDEKIILNSPCQMCGYGGKHLDAPPCTTCPAYPKKSAYISQKEWVAEWKRGRYPSGTHYLYCSKCGEINGKSSMFCPNCGRGMSPDAWAKFDKLLRECTYE